MLVNTHCYESTDFSAFIRHTNEFQFPIAAVRPPKTFYEDRV